MRKTLAFLTLTATSALLFTGCAGPEQKLGRGIRNTMEIVRLGSLQRSVEQTSMFEGADVGITTGVIKGFNETIARTGMGVIDTVTFPIPFPPYHAWGTNDVPALPQYPASRIPLESMRSLSSTMADRNMGFSGGTLLPWIPGNTFSVFAYPW